MKENDDELVELLLIPKVGRARARALFDAGYKDPADIAAADAFDLAMVPGISIDMAKELVELAGAIGPAGTTEEARPDEDDEQDGFWYKDDGSRLFICPECGSMVSDGSEKCPVCGVLFDEDEEEAPSPPEKTEDDDFWYKEQKNLFMCPNCGSFVPDDADGCSACGIVFEADEEEAPAEPEEPVCPMCQKALEPGAEACDGCGFDFTKEKEHDDFWYKEGDGLFMCPNCGIFLPASASQCSACGIVFEEGEEEVASEPRMFACPMCGKELEGGVDDCPDCGFDFSAQPDGFWMKEQKGLFMCPKCGSLAPEGAGTCPNCGVMFDEDIEESPAPEGDDTGKQPGDTDEFWVKEQKGLSMCPKCGAFISPDAEVCNSCGVAFDEGDEELEPAPDFVTCPMCQAVLPSEAGRCEDCGFDFTAEREEDGFWYKKSGTLFICPNCGAFLSDAAQNCHNCGLAFDEEMMEEKAEDIIDSVELDRELDTVIIDDDALEGDREKDDLDVDSICLCPICGALIEPNLTKCPSCSTVFDDIEELALEPADVLREMPEGPGALADEIADDIREIEEELLEEPAREEKGGVSKDFLERWKSQGTEKKDMDRRSITSDFKKRWESTQASEDVPDQVTEEGLEEELEGLIVTDKDVQEGETKLAADVDEQDDHLFWSRRAKDMAAQGDIEEAIACLDRAAELNPGNAVEYKHRMLELMGVGQVEEGMDLSDIVDIDDIGELAVDDKLMAETRLEELDELLEEDRDSAALWQEKGEVLEQLGRHEEAVESYDRSIELSYSSLREEAKPDLRQPEIGIGLTNGQGRVNGRVNGLLTQRGMTNGKGRTNGMINGRGRVNGMVNGKTNGLINGLVNGLVNGTGLTNGLTNGRTNGLINGGLVNGLGLVNGEGMVNGSGSIRRLRHRQRDRVLWRYRLSAMVMFVTIILMLSMLNNLMVQDEMGAINIDGNFADWNHIPSYYDSPVDQIYNPDLNILESKIMMERDRLNLYISVEGNALMGSGANNSQELVDSLVAFIDLDNDPATGYRVAGIGADMAVDSHGWDGVARQSNTLMFNNVYEQDDWNGFQISGRAPVAVGDSEIEVRASLPRTVGQDQERPRVLVMLQDTDGRSDMTDFILSDEPAAMEVIARPSGNDILELNGRDIGLARIQARSRLADSAIFGFNFTVTGSLGLDALTNIRIMNDTDRDGGLGAGDSELAGSIVERGNSNFTFSLDVPQPIPINRSLNFWLVGDIGNRQGTLGIDLVNVESGNAAAFVRNMNKMLHNVGTPAGITIDGAFGDWSGVGSNVDSADDLVFQRGNPTLINKNADLADFRARADEDLNLFLSVGGTMLGGADAPIFRTRPLQAPPAVNQTIDSDMDGVPNMFDPMPYDFNNDGVNNTDSGGDWDGDGEPEHPRGGSDYWLNTTIPADFPARWANRSVSIYVGPIGHTEAFGYDTARVMFDSDNDPATGTNLFGCQGIDHVVIVRGKQNRIASSQLFEFNASRSPEPWDLLGDVDSAIDWYRMELAVPPGALGLSPGQVVEVHASMEDWNRAYDVSDNSVELTAPDMGDYGTRAPKPRLDISKDGPATAAPGETITYTITVTNPSAETAYDVTVTEYYPAGTTYAGATPAPTTGDNVWYVGTLAPGESYTITVSVTLDDTLQDKDKLRNTAVVSFTDGTGWSASRDAKFDTTVVVIPEMQNLAVPMMGLLMVVIIFNFRKRTLTKKKEEN